MSRGPGADLPSIPPRDSPSTPRRVRDSEDRLRVAYDLDLELFDTRDAITRVFGLKIEVTSFQRRKSEIDEAHDQVSEFALNAQIGHQRAKIESTIEQIDTLRSKRNEILAEHPEDPMLAEIDAQVEKLEDELAKQPGFGSRIEPQHTRLISEANLPSDSNLYLGFLDLHPKRPPDAESPEKLSENGTFSGAGAEERDSAEGAEIETGEMKTEPQEKR